MPKKPFMPTNTEARATGDPLKTGRARMTDVASLAGVSLATVSRALAQPDRVSPGVRVRVLAAADRLGFQRSVIAGSLASAKTPIVGVIVPSLLNSFFTGTLQSMADWLGEAGYQLMIGHHEYDLEQEARLIDAFLSWSPSGLVVTGVHHTGAATARMAQARCPVVEMWDIDSRPIDTVIGFDNRAAGTATARYLIAKGHRRLAQMVALHGRDPRATARAQGFTAAVLEAGLDEPLLLQPADRTLGAGVAAFQELAALADRPTALACSGDVLAQGALYEAQRLGIRVPEDIAVIGYGDLDFAPYTNPPLTTLRPPRDAIGRVVAEHLIGRFADPASRAVSVDLGFELVPRASG
jgi:LacI family gluconate utilization system Gnt-I transcriptional repressor